MSIAVRIPAESEASLKRLVASDTFQRAPRLRSLLEFLIQSLLAGRVDEINEQEIGQAVFGRPAGYSQGDDNIVRVSVRHLRVRLEEYYKSEGRGESWVLEIPKGKYIPAIIPRTEAAFELASRHEVPTNQSPKAVATEFALNKRTKAIFMWTTLLPWILVCLLLICVAVLAIQRYSKSKAAGLNEQPSAQSVLQLMLQSGNSVTVVVADSNLQAYRVIYGKQVSLDAYTNHSFTELDRSSSDPLSAGVKQYVTEESDTTVTSAITAGELQRAAIPAALEIRHPHDLSMRDFQHENLILLGGPWINPWSQLFEDQLNFRLMPMSSEPAVSEVHNMNPRPGEPRVFTPVTQAFPATNYARIAMLPNLDGTGRIILIGATGSDALEAGGDFIGKPTSLQELMRSFKCSSANQLPYFELVLEVKGQQNVPGTVRIVALRAIPHQS